MQNDKDIRKHEIKFLKSNKKNSQALAKVEEYLELYPDDYYMMAYKAMILTHLYRYDEAKAILDEVIEHNTGGSAFFFALSEYARILRREKNKDAALECYLKVIKYSDSAEIISRSEAAKIYNLKKEYNKAREILEIPGLNIRYLNIQRAYIALYEGKYEDIEKELERPYENNTGIRVTETFKKEVEDQSINYLLGQAAYAKDDFESAAKYFTKAMECKNTSIYWAAYSFLGQIKYKTDDISRAIAICKNVIEGCDVITEVKRANAILLKSYLKLSDYKSMEKMIDSLEESNLKYYGLGKINMSNYNFDAATENFEKVINNPDDFDFKHQAMYSLAIISFRKHNYDRFYEIYDILKKSKPKMTDMEKLEMQRISLYIDVELGKPVSNNVYNHYFTSQLANYSEEEAKRHIFERHVLYGHKTVFDLFIDTDKLFDDIKDKLTDDIVFCQGFLDSYIINYDNIGYDSDGNKINYINIICLPGTKNIISMYPYIGVPVVNQTEEVVKKEPVKRLTQIEKFNKKYGIK
ncbi:MAG: hypothetical protein IJ565_03585 [Bacilli bacterium]|nr:hypothetical protein [Bacilli bacterium]